MNLSKSRYIDFKQCPKKLWLNTYRRDLADDMDQSIFTMGTNVGVLARDLFPGGVLVEYKDDDKNNIERMLKTTSELIAKGTKIIYEAAFSDNQTLAICDILVRNGENYDIFEVKASTSVKDVHVKDLSFQYHVLQSSGITVGNIFLVYINRLYTRHGNLNLFELFYAEDLTDIIKENVNEIEKDLISTAEILEMTEEPLKDIGMHCDDPYTCQFKGHCFSHVPKNSVFDLAGFHKSKKFDMYYSGIVTYEDIVNNRIKLPGSAQLQINAEMNNGEIVNKEALKDFVKSLWYPLYFLDFETINSAVPLYDGTRPYQQVPTQYSLHYILYEGGILHHSEFLAEDGEEPRRPLAERLVKDIPTDACVLAYNKTFEKSVISQLANKYPDLSKELMQIHGNIHDLMDPFQQRLLYLKEMQGSYSIKAVLPALFPNDPELSYDKLKGVRNGQEAAAAYLALTDMEPAERDKTRRGLLEYCKLDTLAMVKILKKIKYYSNKD